MSPYYKYKKEKFLEKYKCVIDTLEDLKASLTEYRKNDSKIIRRAIFAYFQDFSEYIIDMCESYIIINDGKLDSSSSATKLIEQFYEIGFLNAIGIKLYCIFKF